MVRAAQVRMMLEHTGEALLDAARNGHPVPSGSDAGVYVGCASFEYATVLQRASAKVTTHESAPPLALAPACPLCVMCCGISTQGAASVPCTSKSVFAAACTRLFTSNSWRPRRSPVHSMDGR